MQDSGRSIFLQGSILPLHAWKIWLILICCVVLGEKMKQLEKQFWFKPQWYDNFTHNLENSVLSLWTYLILYQILLVSSPKKSHPHYLETIQRKKEKTSNQNTTSQT